MHLFLSAVLSSVPIFAPSLQQPSLASAIQPISAVTWSQDRKREEDVTHPVLVSLRDFTHRLLTRGDVWHEALDELRQVLPSAEQVVRHIALDGNSAGSGPQDTERFVWSWMVDLASFRLESYPEDRHFQSFSGNGTVRKRGRRALLDLIDDPGGERVLDYLTQEVLMTSRKQSYARRLLALHIIDSRRSPQARLAMLNLARFEDDALRADVLALLPSWPGEAVDIFLVSLLGKKYDPGTRPHPFNLVLQRIRDHPAPFSLRASHLLDERLGMMMSDHDWREVSRAIELSRGLDPMRAVPILLDALTTWDRRKKRGAGSGRVLNDVLRELRRISGRGIGSNPRNWISWWIAVRQGVSPLHTASEGAQEGRTSAQFFGLRPYAERVIFVIDISGSMATEWGTSGHSRYVEAIDQMMRFLQASGEETEFNVVLFSSVPIRARPKMMRATTRNLDKTREALLEREPDGGTFLRPGVEMALGLDGSSFKGSELDTVIVLCDGETQDRRPWVQRMLDSIRAEYRIQFHCVLLSGKGDGVLEALATETGGDFISVGG